MIEFHTLSLPSVRLMFVCMRVQFQVKEIIIRSLFTFPVSDKRSAALNSTIHNVMSHNLAEKPVTFAYPVFSGIKRENI